MRDQVDLLLEKIDRYLAAPFNQDVAARLSENRSGIVKLLSAINQKNFSAAFIGKIGAGKTSAICKVSGLQYDGSDNDPVEVLKTGAGRTTVCEVAVEYATRYSIKVEPLPEDEVQRMVKNFANFIWTKANKNIADEDEGGNLLSEELTRCIRNMLGLTIEKKKEDGKWRSNDKALEFSKNCKSVEEVNDLMFSCLALENRKETEFWPNPEESKGWQVWLKENFARINDGKNKVVSIPARITIRGPFPLMQGDIVWSIVDTRGIDSYIHREDIRNILDTEEVFPIICSSFVDAPDADCRSFYELGFQLGLGRRVARDVTLLILDKNESDKVADIDGDVTDIRDRKSIGRSIREEQVSNKISHEYKISPNIVTFDGRIDAGSEIWDALEARRSAYITSKSNDLVRLISASQEMLSAEVSKVEAFEHDIHALVSDWRASADARSPDWTNFGEYIKSVFSATHHRTLAASIDRKGSWYNLNVYEAINQRARSSAVKFCSSEIAVLKNSLALLRGKYPEFSNQIDALESECVTQFDSFSVYVGDISKEHWIEQVKTFVSIWHSMTAEWGRGSGYKSRVIEHWIAWIKSEQSVSIHNALLRRVASAWGRVLAEAQG
ncbi:MAG: hypothetical protein RLY71_3177 [Pseudomonadota bacterium]|jgi:hypothetical protein